MAAVTTRTRAIDRVARRILADRATYVSVQGAMLYAMLWVKSHAGADGVDAEIDRILTHDTAIPYHRFAADVRRAIDAMREDA